jgi:hypothetical protein
VKALVAGWFSFEGMGATAGDLLARDVLCGWLDEAHCPFDVAVAPPFGPGVNWSAVEPAAYSHLFFVCGPFGNGWPVTDLLARFEGARLVGVDLSLLEPLESWNPFDLLVERDSSRASRPDISLLATEPRVPVVGLVLVHTQREYADGIHADVDGAIERALADRGVAVVKIDTRLDENATGLRSPAQVESLIARMDAVVTTRLHGLVLALKNGVPAVAIDPIRGGAKVTLQARTLGWPHLLAGETLTDEALSAALDRCLEPLARSQAKDCVGAARVELAAVRASIVREAARG